MKGNLFVFEGADGAGKTIHIDLFTERLSEHSKVASCSWSSSKRHNGASAIEKLIKEFGDESIQLAMSLIKGDFYDEVEGDIIERAIATEDMNHRNAMLFSLSIAMTTRDIINPALVGGTNIVCDRLLVSTLAYQGLSSKPNGDTYMDDTKTIIEDTFAKIGVEIPKHTCIYIYISDDAVRINRLYSRTDQMDSLDRNVELQNRLSTSYETVFEKYSRQLNTSKLIRVDNIGSIESAQKTISKSIPLKKSKGPAA